VGEATATFNIGQCILARGVVRAALVEGLSLAGSGEEMRVQCLGFKVLEDVDTHRDIVVAWVARQAARAR